jgi:hypothetical protein
VLYAGTRAPYPLDRRPEAKAVDDLEGEFLL